MKKIYFAALITIPFVLLLAYFMIHRSISYRNASDFVRYLDTDTRGYNEENSPEYNFESFQQSISGYSDDMDFREKGLVIYALEEFMRRKEYRPSGQVINLVERSRNEEVLFVALRYLSMSGNAEAVPAVEKLAESGTALVRNEARRTLSALEVTSIQSSS